MYKKLLMNAKKSVMDEIFFEIMSLSENEQTQRVFRTAYFISKVKRPYTDMPKLMDL